MSGPLVAEVKRDISEKAEFIAVHLAEFGDACPASLAIPSGAMLARHLAERTPESAQIAWLIEIMNDCAGQLASHLSERLA